MSYLDVGTIMIKASKRSDGISYAIREVIVPANKQKKQGNKELQINNGPQNIDTILVTAVLDAVPLVTIDSVTATPGQRLTISDVDTTGSIAVTITYNVVDSGLTHTDVGTIHN